MFSARASCALLVLSLVACSGDNAASNAPTSAEAATIIGSPDCGAAREVATVLGQIDLSDREGIEALPSAVRQLADVLPAELGEDVDTLASAVDALVGVLREYDFDLAAIEEDANAQLDLEELNRPEVSTSTQRIQQWIDESCA